MLGNYYIPEISAEAGADYADVVALVAGAFKSGIFKFNVHDGAAVDLIEHAGFAAVCFTGYADIGNCIAVAVEYRAECLFCRDKL